MNIGDPIETITVEPAPIQIPEPSRPEPAPAAPERVKEPVPA